MKLICFEKRRSHVLQMRATCSVPGGWTMALRHFSVWRNSETLRGASWWTTLSRCLWPGPCHSAHTSSGPYLKHDVVVHASAQTHVLTWAGGAEGGGPTTPLPNAVVLLHMLRVRFHTSCSYNCVQRIPLVIQRNDVFINYLYKRVLCECKRVLSESGIRECSVNPSVHL